MANRTKMTAKRKSDFILAMRENGGHVSDAARTCNISRDALYRHKDLDAEFAAEWETAIRESTSILEDEAIRRAVQGTDEPVFHQGVVCGHVRKYSDKLLLAMLRARRPDVYRESFKHEHGGPGGGPIPTHTTHALDLSKCSDDELATLRSIAARQAKG